MADLKPELERRQSNRDAIAEHFKTHPNRWISASELAEIGGILAWRTRVSDCRLTLEMHIENWLERSENLDGTVSVTSYYRYLPQAPLGRAADMKAETTQPDTLFALYPRA